jgi:citrate lyase subunit beta/citryl-CoA lyase
MDRSYLFVPANRPERFDKACNTGAHAVILDLEDAVGPADKESARDSVRRWLSAEKPAWLRINGPESEWFSLDLDIAALDGVQGIMLPKVEDVAAIADVRKRIRSSTRIVPLIESALGLWRAEAIARAEGVERLAFGSVDFQLDTGIAGEREELLYARSQLVLVSRVAGRLPPVDGVTVSLDDESLLRDDVKRARLLGFGGKLCIHPKQVAAINAGFSVSDADLAWARRILDAADSTTGSAIRLDGKLVDRPIVERARALLDQARGRAS